MEYGMPPLTPEEYLANLELLQHLFNQIPWVPILWVLAPIASKYAKHFKPILDLAHAAAALLGGHA